jgi:S-DNA-T family DNA segregation ATPase FtsK/SpoIIIE
MASRGRQNSESHQREVKKPSTDRRTAILALLLMAAAILIFLALVSYDASDEANADIHATDLLKVFTGDSAARAKADTAHNWLGLGGAILSDVLIKSTIGYAIFVLPVLMLFWGWVIFRKTETRPAVTITNIALIGSLLVSSSFGMLRLILGEDSPGMEWSGVIGDFLASILAQLLGKTGGAIILLVGILVTLVLAVDLDLRQTADRLRRLWLRVLDWLERKRAERAARKEREDEKDSEEEPPSARLAGSSSVRISRTADREEEDSRAPVKIAFGKKEGPPPASAVERGPKIEVKPLQSGPPAEPATSSPRREVEIDYVFPSVDLLDPPRAGKENIDEEELQANADLLRRTLAEFDVELESVSVTPGPVVTLYELVPASGVKISRIVSLENDMALKLAAKGIRIMAPIPGKSAVGVEIPNSHRSLVTIRSVLNSTQFRDMRAHLPLGLGKTIAGEIFTDDLTKMPHLLIAGSTGSGKSVGINTIIASLLYRMHPSDLRFIIIDPKKIELAQYAKLKNHFLAISPDTNEEIVTTPHNAVAALRSVEVEMERRYDRLSNAGVRNIVDYNERVKSGRLKSTDTIQHTKMPYLVVIIDELADLMMTAAREVEEPIARLAQMARAVGIHLVLATQRPSVDVITGVIKANFPARIAYQVASKVDSRTILDMNGAEQLLGNGDMLYLPSGSPKPVRLQNAYISPDEVDRIVEHVAKQQGYVSAFVLPSMAEKKRGGGAGGQSDRDELFEDAARLIVRHQQGSVSLLQRRLKVGYSRAARLVDELEMAGIVGPFDGSKARDVLIETEAALEAILQQQEGNGK